MKVYVLQFSGAVIGVYSDLPKAQSTLNKCKGLDRFKDFPDFEFNIYEFIVDEFNESDYQLPLNEIRFSMSSSKVKQPKSSIKDSYVTILVIVISMIIGSFISC